MIRGAAELVQFADLTPSHFERRPIWLACRTADYDEPWYEDTDEETFRPWLDDVPVAPDRGMFLVRATFTTLDKVRLGGFVTPCAANDVGAAQQVATMQPHVFLPTGKLQGFWYGILPVPVEVRATLYEALRGSAQSVFPISFEADVNLTTGVASGIIEGFYTIARMGDVPAIVR